MMMREEEKSKVNSSQIRSLEKKVDRIDEEIQLLVDEFDLNINRILGNDLIVEINKYYGNKKIICPKSFQKPDFPQLFGYSYSILILVLLFRLNLSRSAALF